MKKPRNGIRAEVRSVTSKMLGNYPERFRKHLSEQSYARSTIDGYLRYVRILAVAMEASATSIENLDEGQAVALVCARSGSKKKGKRQVACIVRRFVRFVDDQVNPKAALPPTAKEITRAELRENYETYLRLQRGVSENTIVKNWVYAVWLLEYCFGEEADDFSKITPADIAGFLQHLTTERQTYRVKNHTAHVRNFLRYLFQAGKTTSNLALVVPKVAKQYARRLPRHL